MSQETKVEAPYYNIWFHIRNKDKTKLSDDKADLIHDKIIDLFEEHGIIANGGMSPLDENAEPIT